MRRISLLAVVLLVGALFTGCGDDDEALSKSEFLRKGNAVCKTFGDRIDAAGEKAFGSLKEGEQPSDDAIRSFFSNSVRPNLDKLIDGIDELEPPDELKDEVDDLLGEVQKAFDELKDAVDENPQKAFSDESGDPFEKADKMAADIGLNTCAED
jgi:hypothetical protein